MAAWIFQDPKQVAKRGEKDAPWCVGWRTPDGRRKGKTCGVGKAGKRIAADYAEKLNAQLLLGTYQDNSKKTWREYRQEYEVKIIQGMNPGSAGQRRHALNQFERLVNPQKVQSISNLTLAEFVAKRREERGLKEGSKVSPATVNKELRELRAVLRKAMRWGYITKPFDFEFLKQFQRIPTFVPPDHFGLLYVACGAARLPDDLPFGAAEWWRGLLVLAYMTGWRIGQLLAFRRTDLDFETGLALTRAEENKGKRDQKIPLHPVVLEHLQKLASFATVFFPWNHDRRKLYKEFEWIQREAGIKPMAQKPFYTFHDFRRGFATMNADRMTPDALQAHMQHRDHATTQGYINLGRQLRPAMENLFVPEIPKIGIA